MPGETWEERRHEEESCRPPTHPPDSEGACDESTEGRLSDEHGSGDLRPRLLGLWLWMWHL